MADEETASLRNEVTRLNNIIDIMLESNRQLKNALAFYQQTAILPRYVFDASHQQTGSTENDQQLIHSRTDGTMNDKSRTPLVSGQIKNVQHGIPTEKDRAANVQRPMHVEKDGVNIVRDGMSSQMDGVNIVQDGISSRKDGVNIVQQDIASQKGGVNNVQHYIHQLMEGVNIDPRHTGAVGTAATHLPPITKEQGNTVREQKSDVPAATAKPKRITFSLVQGKLMELNPKANYSGIGNTAVILIQLYQSPKQSLKDLQKITGLSEDGIVKRIMSMKKRGMIVRAPGGRLELTGLAKKIIEDSIM